MGPPKTKKDRGGGGGGSTNTKEKEEANSSKAKDERLEQLQADHELFLQAFESKLRAFVWWTFLLSNKEPILLLILLWNECLKWIFF